MEQGKKLDCKACGFTMARLTTTKEGTALQSFGFTLKVPAAGEAKKGVKTLLCGKCGGETDFPEAVLPAVLRQPR